jgi:DNA replication protein DnaC
MDPVERLKVFREFVRQRGRRYATCSLDSFKAVEGSSDVLSALKTFCDEMLDRLRMSQGGLVLLGPPGTGKDHLLMGVMRFAIIEHGLHVKWFDGLQLFNEIKQRIDSGTVLPFVNDLCKVQVLAISDPVPPRDLLSAYELSKLREIVDKRYSNGMATWITTNVQTAEDARRLFTDAVLSRLLDGALELFCGWKSYRSPQR